MIKFLTPQDFIAKDTIVSYDTLDSPFGPAMVGHIKEGICWLSFGDMEKQLQAFQKAFPNHKPDFLTFLASQIFTQQNIPLVMIGTPFQHDVWKALKAVPKGEIRAYKDIATEIQKPMAVRAVGTAIGTNPVSYLVPCHRILRTNKALGGYRWGVDIKQKMLAEEQVKV